MKNLHLPLLYDVPIAVAGIGFILVLLIGLEAGYRVGLVRRKKLSDADAGRGGVELDGRQHGRGCARHRTRR